MVLVGRLALFCDPRTDDLLVVLGPARPIGRLLGGMMTASDGRRNSLLDPSPILDLLDGVIPACFRRLGARFPRLGSRSNAR